jgi:hypothetical protein
MNPPPENTPLARRLRLLVEHAGRPFARRAHNPAFSIDSATLAAELKRIRKAPAPLERPVVVVSGWRAPGVAPRLTASRLARLTSQRSSDFIPVSLMTAPSLDGAANTIIDAVAKALSNGDRAAIPEVDIVGISMGGLASRLAAAPRDSLGQRGANLHPERLPVARLFTLATPHRGASLAQIIALDTCAKEMCPGGDLFRTLDESLAEHPIDIIPYARLHDAMVGAQNAAPPGMNPIWIDDSTALAHLAITTDKRIMLDLALRLRGETPIASHGEPPPLQ